MTAQNEDHSKTHIHDSTHENQYGRIFGAAARDIARCNDEVRIVAPLPKRMHELRTVRPVGVHEDHKRTSGDALGGPDSGAVLRSSVPALVSHFIATTDVLGAGGSA